MQTHATHNAHGANADPAELAKFGALAHKWWDPDGEFKPLHAINPLRLGWIADLTGGLAGKAVCDVGCGGGILAESMVAAGATVTGIDLSEKPLSVARLHGLESGIQVDYRLVSAEAMADAAPAAYDVVTCMELLEHVPAPASTVAACARLVKPGGLVAFSTLNRNLRSYAFAIVGAEYVLGLLPRGTHEWQHFIRPSELAHDARRAGLELVAITGMHYNPLSRAYTLGPDTAVNYLAAFRRPLA